MSYPFYGEIRIFGFSFAPEGWALCNGQIMSIQQNTALFSIIGTYFGGNGQTTFALPNLQGACAIHQGTGVGLSTRVLGETGGSQTVTLVTSEMPSHTHAIVASSSPATTPTASGNVLAQISAGGTKLAPVSGEAYSTHAPNVTMAPIGTSASGGGGGHNNMGPYLAVNLCICLQGVYPARQAIGQDKLNPSTVKPPKTSRKVG